MRVLVSIEEGRYCTLKFSNGLRVTINEIEAEQTLLYLKKFLYRDDNKTISSKQEPSIVEKFTTQVQISKPNFLPAGFRELDREESYSTLSNEPTFFIYAKNDKTQEYGFKVVNGKEYPFAKLGAVNDPESPIGSFYQAIPENETLVTSDFLKLEIEGVTVNNYLGGRRLKAALAILRKEGYLRRTPNRLLTRRGAFGYYKYSLGKDGDEGESIGKTNMSSSPNPKKIGAVV